eukprot:4914911-Prymnesium_polylepis.2
MGITACPARREPARRFKVDYGLVLVLSFQWHKWAHDLTSHKRRFEHRFVVRHASTVVETWSTDAQSLRLPDVVDFPLLKPESLPEPGRHI